MLRSLLNKFKEALISVAPVSLIVIILSFTPLCDLNTSDRLLLIASSLLLVIGIGFFNLGADLAMTPMGEYMGSGLVKTKRLFLILGVLFGMGMLITIAEPDLSVLAKQVSAIMSGNMLILTVGVGVGIFLSLSALKILFSRELSKMLMFFYALLFALSAILIEQGGGMLIPLSFDSGGVTTGPITVPFIMALGVGIAASVGGKRANENSFGLIALCSVGPMLAVLALSLFSSGELTYEMPDYSLPEDPVGAFFGGMGTVALEVIKALGLIVIFFMVIQITVLKLPKKRLSQIAVGIIYTFIGLVIFLSAVSVGFMPIGYKLGTELAKHGDAVLVGFAFLIGAVVVLAEPAIHVLNRQVEDITDGGVSKKEMLLALCIGVGVSIGLSMIRIILDFSVLYYLVPGYLISLGLSFFVPRLYTAIAFDSGGVASGPLTSSFILPLMIGVCFSLTGDANAVLSSAFGVVAMVAMTPLITIQALGFKAVLSSRVRERIQARRIISKDDEQIIYFSVKEDR